MINSSNEPPGMTYREWLAGIIAAQLATTESIPAMAAINAVDLADLVIQRLQAPPLPPHPAISVQTEIRKHPDWVEPYFGHGKVE